MQENGKTGKKNGHEIISTTISVPNSAGNLWVVPTLDGSTGVLTASDNMTAETNTNNIQ